MPLENTRSDPGKDRTVSVEPACYAVRVRHLLIRSGFVLRALPLAPSPAFHATRVYAPPSPARLSRFTHTRIETPYEEEEDLRNEIPDTTDARLERR